MIFIFGFGNQTTKDFGNMPAQYCGRCHNQTRRMITKATTWFSLFFIPLIPYRSNYLLVCPICTDARELEKYEFEEILRNVDSNGSAESGAGGGRSATGGKAAADSRLNSEADKYAGKNATQIAYLKKLEAHEKALAEQERQERLEGQ